MKYLMSINEFFKFPESRIDPVANYERYKESCRSDFDNLYTDKDWENIFEILKRDCGDFLDEIKDAESIIFRGIKSKNKETIENGLYKKVSRTDRWPSDMRRDVSDEFDELFVGKFNIPIRKCGIFATKDPFIARSFTRYNTERKKNVVFLLFPIGEYSYFWNPKINDLYSEIENQHWYIDYDYLLGDQDPQHSEDMWWSIYGEPRVKRDIYDWYSGGGVGHYSYKGIDIDANRFNNKKLDILDDIVKNPEKWGSVGIPSEGIEKYLVWIPKLTFDEYERLKQDEVSKSVLSEMSQIVSGYKEGDLKEVGVQEMTFVCKEYYLLDEAFLHKVIEWIDSK